MRSGTGRTLRRVNRRRSEVVLVGRLREAIRRLNPAIPEEARAVIRNSRTTRFGRNNR